MYKLLVILVTALFGISAHAADSAAEILNCVRGNVPSGPTVSEVEVTTTDRAADESQTLAGRIFAARQRASGDTESQLWAMLRVDDPGHLEGAAYLVREVGNVLRDEMFVFLPAVGRVRRITGSFANAPLLGTTFSYFDFKQIWNAFGDLTPAAVGDPDEIRGRPVHKLHLTPRPDTEIEYSKVSVWVDRESCLPLRADFKSDGELVKRFTVPEGGIAQSEGRWYLGRIHMRDIVDNVESDMRIENLKTMDEPGGPFFDPETFHQQE